MDDPQLTVRLAFKDIGASYERNDRSPVRVVLDSQQQLMADAKILQQAGETWQLIREGVSSVAPVEATRLVAMPGSEDGLDLHAVLDYLGDQQMNNVLVEAGAKLAAGFLKAGLVDELIVYQSPDIMGSSAYSMFNLPEILKMSEKIRFEYRDLRNIGRDLKLLLFPTDHT
jgi:diaminohydroxyphosphoribosylaminopyrimidine deaminase/5-amino-6-(5-phosphoribosylamino)uracil reductase